MSTSRCCTGGLLPPSLSHPQLVLLSVLCLRNGQQPFSSASIATEASLPAQLQMPCLALAPCCSSPLQASDGAQARPPFSSHASCSCSSTDSGHCSHFCAPAAVFTHSLPLLSSAGRGRLLLVSERASCALPGQSFLFTPSRKSLWSSAVCSHLLNLHITLHSLLCQLLACCCRRALRRAPPVPDAYHQRWLGGRKQSKGYTLSVKLVNEKAMYL